MPPLPPIPGVIKVQVKGTYSSGYKWANVLHFSYSGAGPNDGEAEIIADNIYGFFTSEFKALMPATTTTTEVVVTDLASSTSGEGTFSGTTAGTRTGSAIGANSAFLVSKTITARYRGGHPRSYMAIGVSADLVDEGHWTGSFVTSATNAFTSFINDCLAAGTGPVVIDGEVAVSYYTTDYTTTPPKRVRRTVPLVYPITEGYVGNAELASQRRRIGRKR